MSCHRPRVNWAYWYVLSRVPPSVRPSSFRHQQTWLMQTIFKFVVTNAEFCRTPW